MQKLIMNRMIAQAILFFLICFAGTAYGNFPEDQPVRYYPEDFKRALETRQCAGCVLTGVDFSQADLTGGIFVKTLFNEANLSWAVLKRANLRGAVLEGCDLSWSNLDSAELQGALLQKADLSYASMNMVSLVSAYLEQTDLKWVSLREADLTAANFKGANLLGANFESADLERTNFRGAYLEKANFRGAKLDRTHFEGAILKNAIWTDGSRCLPRSIGKCLK